MSPRQIPLTQPALGSDEEEALLEVLRGGVLSGDGRIGRSVEGRLRELTGAKHALLTTSGSHALELAMLSLDLGPADEVILPSFTFTATANAIALRQARPVFVDIDERTWNLDPAQVEAAITPRTRGIIPVHYAGQGCDMAALLGLAEKHGLWVVEDAAQAVDATFAGRTLGTFGSFGCLSFHQTKNVVCGEGGALLTDDGSLARRAEILREKGTNRAAFFRGEVDKYTWVDVGSSYVLSEVLAALLGAQLEKTKRITAARRERWERYHRELASLEEQGAIQRPRVHPSAVHNAHLYGIVVSPDRRDALLGYLKARGVGATFHYVPLHSAPAAARFGPHRPLPVTDRVSFGLIRLPLFPDLTEPEQAFIIEAVRAGVAELGMGRT